MSERKRTVLAPLRDVRVVDKHYKEGDSFVTFHIKNDDPESSVTSIYIQCEIKDNNISQVSVGYFPGVSGDSSPNRWTIGLSTPPELRPWLGVDGRSMAPFIGAFFTKDSNMAEWIEEYKKQNPRDPWETPYAEMTVGEQDEIRKTILRTMAASLGSEFDKFELDPECQRKAQALLDEIFERVGKHQKPLITSEYLAGLLNDPQRGVGRSSGA